MCEGWQFLTGMPVFRLLLEVRLFQIFPKEIRRSIFRPAGKNHLYKARSVSLGDEDVLNFFFLCHPA